MDIIVNLHCTLVPNRVVLRPAMLEEKAVEQLYDKLPKKTKDAAFTMLERLLPSNSLVIKVYFVFFLTFS